MVYNDAFLDLKNPQEVFILDQTILSLFNDKNYL